MPLIVICGPPCVGKTHVATKLQEYFVGKGRPVILLNEESLGITPEDAYQDGRTEMHHRAALKTAVDRALSSSESGTLCICDSVNYIRGYRYELYCLARQYSTQCCCVRVCCSEETAAQFHLHHPHPLSAALYDDMWSRFEEPSARNKWENPLFIVDTDPGEAGSTPGEAVAAETSQNAAPVRHPVEIPFAPIEAAIYQGVAPTPNRSTQRDVFADSGTVFELGQVTQAIVNALIDLQRVCLPGDELSLPHCTKKFVLPRTLGLPELRRLRRNFMHVSQHQRNMTELARGQPTALGDLFVDYLLQAPATSIT
ncbi:putative Protein KTI12 [Paratrimastix pyriformis]|uniref:Uncharacterized protein n=1 Tax=Paratrimastix pyriformis TaxID=342808 RepID=A0ABQ8UGI7_9EUKA|nr:putative Protein KTI12 [Paratrimastix pyriformis]